MQSSALCWISSWIVCPALLEHVQDVTYKLAWIQLQEIVPLCFLLYLLVFPVVCLFSWVNVELSFLLLSIPVCVLVLVMLVCDNLAPLIWWRKSLMNENIDDFHYLLFKEEQRAAWKSLRVFYAAMLCFQESKPQAFRNLVLLEGFDVNFVFFSTSRTLLYEALCVESINDTQKGMIQFLVEQRNADLFRRSLSSDGRNAYKFACLRFGCSSWIAGYLKKQMEIQRFMPLLHVWNHLDSHVADHNILRDIMTLAARDSFPEPTKDTDFFQEKITSAF